MYKATCGIHVPFAHHVRGHRGPCISLHGHTWMLEVTFAAKVLDPEGFVIDFDRIHDELLTPCFQLLDHSLAVGATTWSETEGHLIPLGETLLASRDSVLGHRGTPPPCYSGELGGARNERPGGIKVAVFPFTPTSERLAEWLYRVSVSKFADDRVSVVCARIYESLQPAPSFAEFSES